MQRFDALQGYLAGMLSLIRTTQRRPCLALALTRAVQHELHTVLAAVPVIGAPKPWQRLGLLAIYSATMLVWQRDDSPDLARTMAALDGHLRRTELLVQRRFGKA
jgi:ubiquinone biosynthesis protein COQ9